MSNTEQPQTTEQINEWSEICDLMSSRILCCPWATENTTRHIRWSYGFCPYDQTLTKVIYSITEEDEDVYEESDNSTIPSYLVGGLDLDIGSDYDSDNSTILSYLLDNIDLDLHSDSEDEDDQVVPVSKLNAE